MIKKFAEFINEDVTDIYSRLIKNRMRDEDVKKREEDVNKIKEFMSNFEDEDIEEYTINSDNSIDVIGTIFITNEMLMNGKLPVKFGKVSGSFLCCGCKSLTSLEGVPNEVGKGFFCNSCKSITSLKGAPEKVGEDFDCSSCKSLTSLEGAPKEVGGYFDCSQCFSLKSHEISTNIKGKFIKE